MSMRQILTPSDEPFLFVRSLAIDYSVGATEHSHAHPWPQLLYAERGAIRAEMVGRSWLVPPRWGVWVPAGTTHSFRTSSNTHLRTIYIQVDAVDFGKSPKTLNVSALLHETIIRTCEIGALDTRCEFDRKLAGMVAHELNAARTVDPPLKLPADSRALRLCRMFSESDQSHQSLDDLVFRVGLTRRTAERIFLKETGMTPAAWRRVSLLYDGFGCIAGGGTIETASQLSGYQSPSAFASAFRRLFGHSPSAAR
ncbi:helix-turn-helix domain-containing protein [bacterium]|nr:helix-turn-helix domain-containing protein [bacterium]